LAPRWNVVYNVPTACNRAPADFILSSPLMREDYRRTLSVDEEAVRSPDAAATLEIATLLEPFSAGPVTT
jgi:hypothetical protein